MHKPVISIGVFPIGETSRDLAPNGTAITPSTSYLGRKKQDVLRFFADKVLFNRENKLINSIFDIYGIEKIEGNLFDVLYRKSNLVMQSGSPGFEYKRSDLSNNIRFIGPVLPYSRNQPAKFGENDKLERYKTVILVTQGTVEKDTRKIIEPTLKAFAGSEYLVIATTGGSNTSELKNKYKQDNMIIEDFIPFSEIMPFANVFVTNGGYGGVMLGIEHGLPLVVAGIHEGKNEINARIEYFELGRNLKTETPTPQQIKKNVERVLNNHQYRYNVQSLGEELSRYNPNELCDKYIAQLMQEEENNTLSLFNSQKVA
jgi:UDP:flavonoid glycosyltransferase YjiC (YdhE family)